MTDNLSLNLTAVQFSILDLRLYLDTHPEDLGAVKLYSVLEEKYCTLKEEYENKYGPLYNNSGAPGVQWLKNPWPWDYEGGNR